MVTEGPHDAGPARALCPSGVSLDRDPVLSGISRIMGAWTRIMTPLPFVDLRPGFKISFCTTCMGRLHHLKRTLEKNLEDNADYPDLEFVLLDYSSSDGMSAWVHRTFRQQIETGRIRYARVEGARYYDSSHAKNVAHRLASGEVVCNLDADNFTGKGFARYLEKIFLSDPKACVHGHYLIRKGTTGRIAVATRYFVLAGGYDERFRGWSYDDRDLIARLIILGLHDHVIRDERYLEVIDHDSRERVANFPSEWYDVRAGALHNQRLSQRAVLLGAAVANRGMSWGHARIQFKADV